MGRRQTPSAPPPSPWRTRRRARNRSCGAGSNPTAIRFAQDGRVFVAEQGGLIVSTASTIPAATIYANLPREGELVLGSRPAGHGTRSAVRRRATVCVRVYTHDAGDRRHRTEVGRHLPEPGCDAGRCVVSGRLSAGRSVGDGPHRGLVPAISEPLGRGDRFRSRRRAVRAAGDGASADFADCGQDGNPVNPCGDPGGSDPPAERRSGGYAARTSARRSTRPGSTGRSYASTPTQARRCGQSKGKRDANTRRIIAHGFGNPFRIAFRPGTRDLYVGDVGWNLGGDQSHPEAGRPRQLWLALLRGRRPDVEFRQPQPQPLRVALRQRQRSGALLAYAHPDQVADETCSAGTSSIAGLEFYDGGTFPATIARAVLRGLLPQLHLGDVPQRQRSAGSPHHGSLRESRSRAGRCSGGTRAGTCSTSISPAARSASSIVSANGQPVARATANRTSGSVPLTVQFDGRTSSDPDGDPLSFAWELDGDGAYDDGTSATPSFGYPPPAPTPRACAFRPGRAVIDGLGHKRRERRPPR